MLTLKTPLDKRHLRELFIELVKGSVSGVNELGFDDKERNASYLTLRQILVQLERARIISTRKFDVADRIINVIRPTTPDGADQPGGNRKGAR